MNKADKLAAQLSRARGEQIKAGNENKVIAARNQIHREAKRVGIYSVKGFTDLDLVDQIITRLDAKISRYKTEDKALATRARKEKREFVVLLDGIRFVNKNIESVS